MYYDDKKLMMILSTELMIKVIYI